MFSSDLDSKYSFILRCWWPVATKTVVGFVPAGAVVQLERSTFSEADAAMEAAYASGLSVQIIFVPKVAEAGVA